MTRRLKASTAYVTPFATSKAPDALPVATIYADATSLGAGTVATAPGTNAYTVSVTLPGNVTNGQVITAAVDWSVDSESQSTARLLIGIVGPIASDVRLVLGEPATDIAKESSVQELLGRVTAAAGDLFARLATMIENVGGWRWTAKAVEEVSGSGPDARLLTIAAHTGDSPETGDPVNGLQFRIGLTTITTDTAGAASINLNPGTYTARVIPPPLFAAIDDIEITIAGDDVDLEIACTPTQPIPPADDPALCNVAVDTVTQHGIRPDDAIVWAVPTAKLPGSGGSLVVTETAKYPTTDAPGRAIVPMLRGTPYMINVEYENRVKSFAYTPPNAANATATLTL